MFSCYNLNNNGNSGVRADPIKYLDNNAFSFNAYYVNNSNESNNEDKRKRIRKEEFIDQRSFLINTDNVINTVLTPFQIINGSDQRTTIMIRHIPNKYDTKGLLEEISSDFIDKFNFFYLPLDTDVLIYF